MTTPKISLSFTKKVEKKVLQSSALTNDAHALPKGSLYRCEEIKHTISSFDTTQRCLAAKLEDELIIPIIESQRDAIFKRLQHKSEEERRKKEAETENGVEESKPLSLDEQAAAALIKESTLKVEEYSRQGSSNNLTIQLNSTQTIDNETILPTGKVSSLDDYEQVSVESYGAALLRGMGWSKDEGVGKVNKRVVEIVNPTNKAFAFTNNENKQNKDGKNEEEEEEEEVKKGSYVLIHSGRNRGTYGIVEVVDEDHLLVKPARDGNILREVEQNVRCVSAKEFRELSRVINKQMYDEFKAAEVKKKERVKDKRENEGDKTRDRKDHNHKQKYEYKYKNIENKYTDNREYKDNKSKDYDKSKIETSSAYRNSKNKRPYKEDEEWNSGKRKKEYKEDEHPSLRKQSEEKEELCQSEDKYKADKSETLHRKYDVSHSSELRRDEKKRIYLKDKIKNNDYENLEIDVRGTEKRNDVIRQSYSSERSKSSVKIEKKYVEPIVKGKEHHSKSGIKTNKDKKERPSTNSYNKSIIETLKKDQSSISVIPWARENLKVRIINKDYKNGRYHKEKVTVRSVETVESCTCVTEDGKVLENLNPNWFETVIPKTHSAIVLIVNGKYKGHKGRILQLHKEEEKATIQLLLESSVIIKLCYNDICEYVCR